MPVTSFLLLVLAALTTAAPTPQSPTSTCDNSTPPNPPPQPSSTLPAPTTALKYIAIGVGTQNYTCASTSATPVAAGALANLYDATSIMTTQGMIGQTAIAQGPCYADKTNSAFGLRQIGMHYFNSAGEPSFDLTMAGDGEFLQAKKIAAMNAPSNACSGRNGNAAVAWLFLEQDGSGRTTNMGSVYRLETAGGNAVSCSGASNGWVTSDYAAEYWFYE